MSLVYGLLGIMVVVGLLLYRKSTRLFYLKGILLIKKISRYGGINFFSGFMSFLVCLLEGLDPVLFIINAVCVILNFFFGLMLLSKALDDDRKSKTLRIYIESNGEDGRPVGSDKFCTVKE